MSCIDVAIMTIADSESEGNENFFIELVYSGPYDDVSVVVPSTIEVLVSGQYLYFLGIIKIAL